MDNLNPLFVVGFVAVQLFLLTLFGFSAFADGAPGSEICSSILNVGLFSGLFCLAERLPLTNTTLILMKLRTRVTFSIRSFFT